MQNPADIYRPYSPNLGAAQARLSPPAYNYTTNNSMSPPPLNDTPPSTTSYVQTSSSPVSSTTAASYALTNQQLDNVNYQLPTVQNGSTAPNTLILPVMTRSRRKGIRVPEDAKDDLYWEKRKRNNQSAKRCRELKRIKGMLFFILLSFANQS